LNKARSDILVLYVHFWQFALTAYVERRTKEGMSNKEIHRCLKHYIVRELHPLILADLADSTASA